MVELLGESCADSCMGKEVSGWESDATVGGTSDLAIQSVFFSSLAVLDPAILFPAEMASAVSRSSGRGCCCRCPLVLCGKQRIYLLDLEGHVVHLLCEVGQLSFDDGGNRA
jgi:hypothetical protein